MFMMRLLGAISFLLGLVATVLAIAMSFRRKPPLSEEVYKDFVRRTEFAAVQEAIKLMAPRTEVDALRAEYLKTVGEVFEILRQMKHAYEQDFKSVERALGRFEGILSRCPGAKVCGQEVPK